MTEQPPDVLVITFGCSTTNARLNTLCPGRNWEYIAMPESGRARLLRTIHEAVAAMTGPDGRLLPELAEFEQYINSLEDR